MQAKLYCRVGQLAGAEYVITNEATIGKGSDSTIVLYPGIISSQHARIYFDDKEKAYYLEDLRSRNGTKLDGVPVTRKERLGKLHVITFADHFDFIFQVIEESRQAAPPQAAAPPQTASESQKTAIGDEAGFVPPALAAEEGNISYQPAAPTSNKTMRGDEAFTFPELQEQAAEEAGQKTIRGDEFVGMPQLSESAAATGREDREGVRTIRGEEFMPMPELPTQEARQQTIKRTQPTRAFFLLEFKIPGKETKTIQLKDGENFVGRLQECEIYVDDPSISRKHAVVTVRSGKVMVKDLGSKNGTFIGDKSIRAEVEILLDSRLKFGAVEAHLGYKRER
jgi:pSer/pThr/pTyr-binding forkhead associated (FHA) protein